MYVHKWQREVYMGNNENAVDQSVFRILSSNGLIGNICCGSMSLPPPPQERPRLNARARYIPCSSLLDCNIDLSMSYELPIIIMSLFAKAQRRILRENTTMLKLKVCFNPSGVAYS